MTPPPAVTTGVAVRGRVEVGVAPAGIGEGALGRMVGVRRAAARLLIWLSLLTPQPIVPSINHAVMHERTVKTRNLMPGRSVIADSSRLSIDREDSEIAA